MEGIGAFFSVINSMYLGYIEFWINLFRFIGVDNPFFGIAIANLFLFAAPFARLWRTDYMSGLFSKPNIFFSIIFSMIAVWISQDWTNELKGITVFFFISVWSIMSMGTQQRMLGQTIESSQDNDYEEDYIDMIEEELEEAQREIKRLKKKK